jgi:hypothetical protein
MQVGVAAVLGKVCGTGNVVIPRLLVKEIATFQKLFVKSRKYF